MNETKEKEGRGIMKDEKKGGRATPRQDVRRLMLGNEAIAWGAIAARVGFATGYPGTPSSEVLETLVATALEYGHYAEWSVNEKVAVEAAAAAAWAGRRSVAVMKNLGLNVAADALTTVAYTGVRAGMVVVSAGDAQCHTSSNELDARLFGRFAGIPVLDPCDPEEAFLFARAAFDLSERLELPIILNSTPRLSHASFALDVSTVRPTAHGNADFVDDKSRWICVAASALIRHRWLTARLAETFDRLGDFPAVARLGSGKRLGILTNGVAHAYAAEAVSALGIEGDVSLLKLAFSYPASEAAIQCFAKTVDELLVVEELEPLIEDQARVALQRVGLSTPVRGKAEGLLPKEGEFDRGLVERAIRAVLKLPSTQSAAAVSLPVRPPVFCPGCPHRSTYYGVQLVLKGTSCRPLVVGDIGCYTLVSSYPFEMLDTLLCMGGGVGMGHGFAQAGVDRPILAIMGDSTFFHSGLSPLANIGYHRSNVTVLLLDNHYTAMTGFQPNPASGLSSAGDPSRKLSIEAVARSLGFDHIEVVPAHRSDAVAKAVAAALAHDGPAMVISEAPCALQEERQRTRNGGGRLPPATIDADRCAGCRLCLTSFGCSAIVWDGVRGVAAIDPAKCIGCGDCIAVCPIGAIGGECCA